MHSGRTYRIAGTAGTEHMMATRKKPEAAAEVVLQAGERLSCADLRATEAVARRLAAQLQPGDVIALYGDLGAGKTAFIQFVVKDLGCTETVSSPSFTLLNYYETRVAPVYHFDFYRIQQESEAAGIGAPEFLEGDGIVFIEWPEHVQNLLPERRYEIEIAIPDYAGSPQMRSMTIRRVPDDDDSGD